MAIDINNNAYLESLFSQTMIQDINEVIQDFYHDLKTSVSDLNSLDLVLSLDHIDPGMKIRGII